MTLWELQAELDCDFNVTRNSSGEWQAYLCCLHLKRRQPVVIVGAGDTAKKATQNYIERVRGLKLKYNINDKSIIEVPEDLCYEEPKTYKEEDIPKHYPELTSQRLNAKLMATYFAQYVKNDSEICNLIRQGIGDKTK